MSEIKPIHEELDWSSLPEVLAEVREQCGVDFSCYRASTVKRRIARRLTASKCQTLTDYLESLRGNQGECRRLFSDLTIKFSQFFRDPELWSFLKETVLPELLSHVGADGRSVSVWSAGCATGEEAYSLAISLIQVRETVQSNTNFHVLGTDVDENAIETARSGVVSIHAMSGLSEPVISNYFEPYGMTLRVKDFVRETTSFGIGDLTSEDVREDVLRQNPEAFDLVLCRNVMIYLAMPAQKAVLGQLAQVVRVGGYLVLGSVEHLPRELTSSFQTIDRELRIFQRI